MTIQFDMKDNYKVTVLLSTFNGGVFLEEQLNSLLGQSEHSWCLVARDDGSVDASLDILKALSLRYPEKVKVLDGKRERLGATGSFAELMSRVETPYMMFCDQDDKWLPDKINKTLITMQTAEKEFGADAPLLVHSDLCVTDINLQSIAPSFSEYQHLNPYLGSRLNRAILQNVVTGCTVMINRPLAKLALPIPDEAIMHDWWLALVAVLFGRVFYINETTILYRQHESNKLGAKEWGIKKIVSQANNPREIRVSMIRTMRQAKTLLDNYQDRMSLEQRTIVAAYAGLPLVSRAERIRTVCKYRFFKHGAIRNIGFFMNLPMINHQNL